MIEDLATLVGDLCLRTELAIVGAGPAGIVTALEVAKSGIDVLLIESGQEKFDPSIQALSDAGEWDEHRHAPMSMAVTRQIGGTSAIWGGRCVPYDPVDFASRPFVGSIPWPVTYEELSQYFQRACDWLVCGRAAFNASEMPDLPDAIVPGMVDGNVTTSTFERWSLPTDFGKTYSGQLRHSAHVRVMTGVTCVEVVCPREATRAEYLECRTLAGKRIEVQARAFVLACGGLEGTRLLMESSGPQGGELGNESGHLGRWYMSHAEGIVANVRFSTPPRSTIYGYERDVDGVYVRRRFAFTKEFQLAQELPNVVAWLGNPDLSDAHHKSGALSFAYLALSSPFGPKLAPDAMRLALTGIEVPGSPYPPGDVTSRGSHLLNILCDPVSTCRFIVGFGSKRFLSPGRRAPGFFCYSKENVYPLQYHGEHLPNSSSRVNLVRETDAVGRRKLRIDLRFSDADVEGVIRAHEHWDTYLRSCGVGQIEYLHRDVGAAVERRLGGGFHQVGTTRMSATPSGGVVDKNLAVYGVRNLYVASSSTFVTAGQANSTFMIIAFAIRLADRLRNELRTPLAS